MRKVLTGNQAVAYGAMLSGVEVAEPELSWIPSVGMMVMGFILPFALTFVAIPLESFIHSSRTVLGLMLVWLLHAVSFSIRLLASMMHGLGRLLVNFYDLVIFLPLRLEAVITKNETGRVETKEKKSKADAEVVSLVHDKTAE